MKISNLLCLLARVWSLVFLFAACQVNPDTTGATNIEVDIVLPTRNITDTEEITVSNCEGNIERKQTLASIKTIEIKSEVDTVAEAADGSEYEIRESLKLQLEMEVENSYKQASQNELARLEEVSMSAVPGFETVYVIQWEQLDHRGELSFFVDSRSYKANYLYRLIVPKLISKEEMACEGTIETVTLTPSTALSMTATSESTPLSPTAYTLTLTTKASLYVGPQIAYGTVEQNPRSKGEKFSVIAKNPPGDWFLVQASDGTRGWLYTAWVNIDFDRGSIPVTEDFPPTPTSTAKPTRRPPSSYP